MVMITNRTKKIPKWPGIDPYYDPKTGIGVAA